MTFACLDIETSWQQSITVIGVYRAGEGTHQLVAPKIERGALRDLLDGVDVLFTYNGARFDLPVIERHLGVSIPEGLRHRDLMYDCWKKKLKGGLKAVERRLGIHRDSEGIDGIAAMNLWAAHRKASCESPVPCCEPLEVLLRYNREDVENLETLARKLGVLS